jgi:transcriptional regulator GlxA family with amidase domain
MRDFTVLVLEGAYATGVSVTLDLLSAAQGVARAGGAVPRWELCSLSGGPVRLAGGMTVETRRLPSRSARDSSVWVIPGLAATNAAAVARRMAAPDAQRAALRLREHVRRRGRVAASCSAVFLLQAAGLLAGRRVTTTWWLAALLREQSPDCIVDADRMVCADGPLVTAGAAFAQTDLVLHLLRARFGAELERSVCRLTLADARQSQAPYRDVGVMAGGDALVEGLIAHVEQRLPHVPAMAELARHFCMSERTLARHVHRATGSSTIALVQNVRLRRARNLLENSRWTVERVAEAVGYQSSSTLRRLMKRVMGMNPGRCRAAS